MSTPVRKQQVQGSVQLMLQNTSHPITDKRQENSLVNS